MHSSGCRHLLSFLTQQRAWLCKGKHPRKAVHIDIAARRKCALQGLIGVTLSAGVPALQDGSHVNRAAFYMGFLYIIAIGLPANRSIVLS